MRENDAVAKVIRHLLDDKRPEPGAQKSRSNSQKTRNQTRNERGVKDLAEFEVTLYKRDLNRVEGADHENQAHGSKRPNQGRHYVEDGNPRSSKENNQIQHKRDAEAQPKYS